MTTRSASMPTGLGHLIDVAILMASADALVGRDVDVKGRLLFEAGEAFFVPDQATFETIRAKTRWNRANDGVGHLRASDLAHLVHVGTDALLLSIRWKILSGARFDAGFQDELTVRVEGTLTRDAGILRIARPRRLRFWSRRPDDVDVFLGTMLPGARDRFVPSPATRAAIAERIEGTGIKNPPRMSKRWAQPWTISDAEWQAVVDALPGRRNRTGIDEAGNHPDDGEPLDVAALMAARDALVGQHVDVKGWLVFTVGVAILVPDEAAMDAIHAKMATDPIDHGGRYLRPSDLTHLVHVGDEDTLIAIEWKVRLPHFYGSQVSIQCTARIEGELTCENGVLAIPRPRRLRFWHRYRDEDATTFYGTLFPAARNRYIPSAARREQMADFLWEDGRKRMPRMTRRWADIRRFRTPATPTSGDEDMARGYRDSSPRASKES